MAPGATGAVGPPYNVNPGQAARALVFTLPIDAQFMPLVTLLKTFVNGASTIELNPVRAGNSASANSVAKHSGLLATWAAV